MATVSFSKWGPDAAVLDAGIAGEALGVFPGLTAYTPWPSMAPASAALPTPCRGAYMARTTTNAIAIFAGTSTKLFKFASMAAWSDFSRAAGYSVNVDDQWEFAQYGPNVYATNINNPLQTCDASAGVIFADAAGSPPQARYIATVGDFLMLGNTNSTSREVRWSSRNDPTTWVRYTKDADSQTFPDGGDIMGLTGWEQGGLIFQTEVVRQMTVRTDAAIMEFHRLEALQGTLAPYSIISRQGTNYYYASNGFQRIDAGSGQSQAIGANWLDSWFLDNSNASTRPRAIIGSFTSRSPKVIWLFAAPGNSTSQIFDHALCYDPTLTGSDFGPWTHAPMSASTIFSAGTTGVSLDGLGTPGLGYALEFVPAGAPGVPYSLDSDVWKGGAPRMGAFDTSGQMNFFTGPPIAAVLQTGLFSPVPGSRAYVNGFRLVADAAAATGRIATTERQQSVETFGPSASLTAQGVIYNRASGRHMRMEVAIPAGATWTKASGISLDDPGILTSDGAR